MAKELPPRPSLEQLKKQAKELLDRCHGDDAEALRLVRVLLPNPEGKSAVDLAASMALHDTQLVLAREYGFSSWPVLKSYVESISNPLRPTWVGAVMGEDLDLVARLARQDHSLLDSFNREFEDPFRYKVFPVATLLFAAAGPPQQSVAWRSVQRRINFELVRLLVEAGADVEIECHHGRPLSWARDRQVVEFLIARGGNLNHWVNNGGTPLNFCVWREDPERARMLLDLGADPNTASPDTHLTSLHTAASMDTDTATELLAILLDRGGDPSRSCVSDQNKLDLIPIRLPGRPLTGETPLHIAAARGDAAKIRVLLDHGAERRVRTSDGQTPRDWAREAGAAPTIIALL